METNRITEVWSCGGGTQSTAIAALIIQERLPKPDIAIMADTGHEKSATWKYLEAVLRPNLESVGVEIVVVKASEWAKHGMVKSGKVLLPMFTTHSGSPSKLPAFCSNEWKRRVVQRYLRSVGVEKCRVWLGMSLEEGKRICESAEQWYAHHYPLVFDVPMRRSDCVHLIENVMGWPTAPRSACYFCPNQGDSEWKHIREEEPEDFSAAVSIERELRSIDTTVTIHRSGKPLDEVDFDSQGELFSEMAYCRSGYCMT